MTWPTTTIITTQMDASSDDPSQARAEIKKMADNVNDMKDARGAAGGIASLDGGGKVPAAELPTLPADKGGTGQTSYSVGDILYASASGVLTKLPAVTAGYVLTSNGAGAAPSWQLAGGGLTSGTRMLFNQSTAPTGWTKDTSAALNDSILRIVTGSVSQGGSQAFSTFNGLSSTGAHTLTTAELPNLTYQGAGGVAGGTGPSRSGVTDGIAYGFDLGGGLAWRNIPSTLANNSFRDTNGNGAHSHSLTHDIKYNDFIVAQKD